MHQTCNSWMRFSVLVLCDDVYLKKGNSLKESNKFYSKLQFAYQNVEDNGSNCSSLQRLLVVFGLFMYTSVGLNRVG